MVHLTAACGGPDSWLRRADNHVFRPFWSPLGRTPALVGPRQKCLDLVASGMGYGFR